MSVLSGDVTGMFAYLPQRLSEVGGVAILVGVAISVLPLLVFGRVSAFPAWSTVRVRLLATVAIALAGVMAIVSFAIDAEPPDGFPQGGHWGSHTDKVYTAAWLVFLAGITAANLFREARFRRGTNSED
jgi:hypothetical protein